MRLNAWLARAGVASRRKADELIKAGRVTVNGEPGQLNTFVQAHDDVRLDGEPLAKQRLAYVLLNKPAGVVTTASDPQGPRPWSISSSTAFASSRSAGSTPTRPARCC
jgi:16S rRNA uridine-516 pseudouridylate synthase and related pseudouridylate synthases